MTNAAPVAVIPAEECYWSILEYPLRRGRNLWSGDADAMVLADMLQEDLPASADEVHAAFASLDDSRVLACAVPVEIARRESERCAAAHPDRLPDCIAADISPESINLLGGRFEPARHQRSRDRRGRLLAGTIVIACALACIGQLRRAAHAESLASASMRDANARLAARWPALSPGDARGALDESLAVASRSREGAHVRDAALDLALVLRSLPTELGGEVTSVLADGDAVHIALEKMTNTSELVASLHPPRGWRLGEPRFDGAPSGARVHLTYSRVPGDTP